MSQADDEIDFSSASGANFTADEPVSLDGFSEGNAAEASAPSESENYDAPIPVAPRQKKIVPTDLYTLLLGLTALFLLVGFVMLLLSFLAYQNEGCTDLSGITAIVFSLTQLA